MTAQIETETTAKAREFLSGACSPEDFEAWIVSAIDEVSVQDELDALWELRVLLTEYGENLRPLEDAQRRATLLLRTFDAPSRTDSGSDNATTAAIA